MIKKIKQYINQREQKKQDLIQQNILKIEKDFLNSGSFYNQGISSRQVDLSAYLTNNSYKYLDFNALSVKYGDIKVISQFPFFISRLVKTNAIVRNIAYIPVSDAVNEAEITSLDKGIEDFELEELSQKFNDVLSDITQWVTTAQIYGGAFLIVENGNNLSTPLEIKKGDKIKYRSITRFELQNKAYEEFNESIATQDFNFDGMEYFFVGNSKIHKSRLLKLSSTLRPPDNFYSRFVNGFGFSIYEELRGILFEYLEMQASLVQTVKNHRYSHFSFKNLSALWSNDTSAKMFEKRMANIQKVKDTDDAVVTDSEDNFRVVNTNININDNRVASGKMLCAAAQIPYNRLFGDRDSTLTASTGENEVERLYNKRIVTIQQHIRKAMSLILDIECKAMYGENLNLRVKFQKEKKLSKMEEVQYANTYIEMLLKLKDITNVSSDFIVKEINNSGFLKTKINVESINEYEETINENKEIIQENEEKDEEENI